MGWESSLVTEKAGLSEGGEARIYALSRGRERTSRSWGIPASPISFILHFLIRPSRNLRCRDPEAFKQTSKPIVVCTNASSLQIDHVGEFLMASNCNGTDVSARNEVQYCVAGACTSIVRSLFKCPEVNRTALKMTH